MHLNMVASKSKSVLRQGQSALRAYHPKFKQRPAQDHLKMSIKSSAHLKTKSYSAGQHLKPKF